MPEFAVTGASGFVGARLCNKLVAAGRTVRPCVRRAGIAGLDDSDGPVRVVKNIGDVNDWRSSFENVRCVVHLAARVHDMGRGSIEDFRATNVDGTRAVLRGALESGVQRLVFLSTIKVNGDTTTYDRPFRASDSPHPSDPYAISKWEAEQYIQDEAARGKIEVVIIRPVLIYGPGVRANFFRMLKFVSSGLPLPFQGVKNRRSVLSLDNLCDLIAFCADSSRASGRVLLAADEYPLSTPELLRMIAKSLERRVTLVNIPPTLLHGLARIVGKSQEIQRLCESLYVDTSALAEFGWTQPTTTEKAMRDTARWFKKLNIHD
jgi:nucleoside-diphosphate-sugar epimerase